MAKAEVAKAQPARTIADNTATKAPKTIGENASRKVCEAKLAAGQAKRRVGAAGTAAKTHVTRNKAAYIAGGAGAVLARRKGKNQD
ncbi:MAG: hypothetical protein FWG73_03335 [Planctomycetaceae bacterium]|nr:hypothetical protein [Planctomycetaceae bacterium]